MEFPAAEPPETPCKNIDNTNYQKSDHHSPSPKVDFCPQKDG
ncbi:hypothetical protein BN1195_02937 [Chryseobacterium oranimense G311]|nr:hypothetical protein [Chryseobacterium oranimense]CEJ70610.1 hypothetical protein BN1195_02937 [Chryseobacterium oranimense G311]